MVLALATGETSVFDPSTGLTTQGFLFDPFVPPQLSATNGLELLFGL
jgi:hypothetical protein